MALKPTKEEPKRKRIQYFNLAINDTPKRKCIKRFNPFFIVKTVS